MNLLTSYFIAPDESSANKLVAVLNAAGYMETAVMPPNEDAPHWAVTVALTNDADRLRVEERARQFETSFRRICDSYRPCLVRVRRRG